MAEHEGVRVVVDHGVLVLQQLACAGAGDRRTDEPGGRGRSPDGAAGCRTGDAAAVLKVVVQGGDGVGDRAGGLEVDEVVDAVTAAGSVSFGRPLAKRGAHVPVLDGQGYQAVRPARDVPRQAPAEAAGADLARAGRRGWPRPGSAVTGRLAVHPGGEVPDPLSERGGLQGAGVRPFAARVVDVVVEQQVPVGDHALQDADGVDDRGDGHPGNVALGTAGKVVAVLVGGGLELAAADQVPSEPVGPGVGTASGTQAKDSPGRIPVR